MKLSLTATRAGIARPLKAASAALAKKKQPLIMALNYVLLFPVMSSFALLSSGSVGAKKRTNDIFRGGANGVFAIINNAPVTLHARFAEDEEITQRLITAAEVPEQLALLDEIQKKFVLTDDIEADPISGYLAQGVFPQAREAIANKRVNASAAILSELITYRDFQRESIKEIGEQLAAKQARISALSKQLADPASQLLSGQKLELERTLANIDREQVGPLKNNRENFITHDRDLTLLIHAIIKFVKAREMGEHRDEYEQGSVHVADNLSWQEIKDLYDQGAAGFILDANKVGSGNHAVIFARNNDIPIVWIPEAARRFQTGDRLSIDAKKGLIVINPDRSVVDRLAVDEREYKRLNVLAKKSWRPEKDRVTLDQPPRPLPLLQHNLLDANNIFKDRKAGDRVGLFRTEGLYDQVRPFKHGLITTFQDLIEHTSEINIRLLDIAEDKWPGFFGDQEKDQFLGTQGGIDYLLNTKLGKALLYDQLKSILIAASRVRHRPQYAKKVRILIPKVIDWQQIEDVRNQLFSIMAEPGQVIGQGFKLADLEIAAMVETAEAVERIEEIAQHCDYLSLGTNDLTQAIMGFSERSRLMTSPETDWLSPAVLTAIRKVIAAGKKFGKPVGCCGEMAKDPLGAILLMLMGLDALSMDSHNLHEINYILSHIRISEWEKLGPPGVIDELLAKKEDGAFVFNAATLRKRLFELINQRHADTSINLQGFIAPRPITYLMA